MSLSSFLLFLHCFVGLACFAYGQNTGSNGTSSLPVYEREEGVLISVEAGPRSAHLVHIPFMPYYKRVPRPARFPAWQFSSSTIDILSLDVDYRDKSLYFFDRDSRSILAMNNYKAPVTDGPMDGFVYYLNIGVANGAVQVAYDWMSKTLYWVDSALKWIVATSGDMAKFEATDYINFNKFKIMLERDLEHPEGLAVDPLTGMNLRKRRKHEEQDHDRFERCYAKETKYKGRGVFAKSSIFQGERFLRYNGNLLTNEPLGDDTYVFEFKYKSKKYWIDATKDDGSLGRLVNDDHKNPNCKVVVQLEKGVPSLNFIAIRDIAQNEEILYNYGPGKYFWRKKKKVQENPSFDIHRENPSSDNHLEDPKCGNQLNDHTESTQRNNHAGNFPCDNLPEESTCSNHSPFYILSEDAMCDNQSNDSHRGGPLKCDEENPSFDIHRENPSSDNHLEDPKCGNQLNDHTESTQRNNHAGNFPCDNLPEESTCSNHSPFYILSEDAMCDNQSNDSHRGGPLKCDEENPSFDIHRENPSSDNHLEDPKCGNQLNDHTESTQRNNHAGNFPCDNLPEESTCSNHSPFYILSEDAMCDNQSNDSHRGGPLKCDEENPSFDIHRENPSSDNHLEDPKCGNKLNDHTKSTQRNNHAGNFPCDNLPEESTCSNHSPFYILSEDAMCDNQSNDSHRGDPLKCDEENPSFDIHRENPSSDNHLEDPKCGNKLNDHTKSTQRNNHAGNFPCDNLPEESTCSNHSPFYILSEDAMCDNQSNDSHRGDPLKCDEEEEVVIYLQFTQPGIRIETSSSSGAKRDYSKLQACYFCGKSVHKMARHLEIVHKNVPEIANLPKVPKGGGDVENKEIRSKAFTKLRNLGNFSHNVNVLLNKSGSLYVAKRPHNKCVTAEDFLPCQYCLAFFMKQELWRHFKNCKFRDAKINYEKEEQKKRCSEDFVKGGMDLLNGALGSRFFSSHDDDNSFENLVLKRFHKDDISRCIRSDDLLLLFGKMQLKKLGRERASQVREKLRILGRLKLVLRSISGEENSSISEYITATKFDLCVKAIQKLAEESNQQSLSGTNTYHKPTLALKAGQFLKRVAGLKKGQAIRDKDLSKKTDVEEFLSLYGDEFHDAVSSIAHQTLSDRKFNKKTVLPLTEDLLKYVAYLENRMIEMTEMLIVDPTFSHFNTLAEITLARILIFNKRRANEASKMLISQFCSRPEWGMENSEMVAALQPIERHLMKQMSLVEVLGKKGRRVPVLLTKSMIRAVQALVDNRPAGVNIVNPHVFPQGDFHHKRGSDIIRRTALAAKLKEPDRITTTTLRKYLATVSQIFGLSSKELEELARHMGHELSVHRHYYRLQDDVIEIAKISRLLIAVEEGRVAQYKDLSLDDISLEDIVLDEENQECMPQESNDEDELDDVDSISQTSTIASAASTDIALDDKSHEIMDQLSQDQICSAKASAACGDSKGKRKNRTMWTTTEKELLKRDLLPKVMQTRKPPTKSEVLLSQSKFPELRNREWRAIKYQTWSMVQQETKRRKQVASKLLMNS